MNASNSECSSGCASGWTLYLNQSSQDYENHENLSYQDYNRGKQEYVDDDGDGNDDEDLSMVSDASSGPPNMNEHENYNDESGFYCSGSSASALVKNSEKKQKSKERLEKKNKQSYLDDTASSPVFSFSKKNSKFSNNQNSFEHDFSASQYKGKSSLKKHFGIFKNSRSSKPPSAEPGQWLHGGLQGRKWE
ncbi:hypothetical protein RJ641_029261 [Dillenia turbinata]|uniref:Uncharacterized protein n=1 Tax=Dillenia turbinata TaxID=194707 RepID=A0AAN8VTC6_9MAGN